MRSPQPPKLDLPRAKTAVDLVNELATEGWRRTAADRLSGYLDNYCLLAPRQHVTEVVSSFSEEDYLALQRRVHRLGRVLADITTTERLYVFSFGSMQGVAHVHWHLAPLPPGVPFREQQFAAVDKTEYLEVPRPELQAIARRIGDGMAALAAAEA